MKIAVLTVGSLAVVALAAQNVEPPKASQQRMTLRLELFVDDLEKSANFYVDVLGFERLPGAPEYVPVRSGSVLIGLGRASALPKRHHFNPEVQTGRRGLGTEIVLEVDDVEASFRRVKESGYEILSPLTKRPWGATDFRLADPDGYYLRITSR